MLNKILLLAEDDINTQFEVIKDKIFAEQKNTLVITDQKEIAGEYIRNGYAVLVKALGEEFVSGVRYVTDDINGCDDEYFKMVFARSHGLPLTVLHTERTIVREMTIDDLKDLYQVYEDDLAKKFIEPLYEYEEEKVYTEKYIENMYGFYGYGLWLVFHKDTGELIGRIGISIRSIDDKECNELGYIIKESYRRKGYAYEVCEAIIRYAKEALLMDELYVVSNQDNHISERLARKLKFDYMDECSEGENKYKIFKKVLDF